MLNLTQTAIIVTGISGSFLLLTLLLTSYLVYSHISYFTSPIPQKYIIRIVCMAFFYGVSSFLSILFERYSIYFDLVCVCYEAFVLYQFFALLLYYFNLEAPGHFPCNEISLQELGRLSDDDGGTEIPITVEEKEQEEWTSYYLAKIGLVKYPFPFCCITPDKPGHVMFVTIRICIFQYMLVKPLLTLLALILETQGLYHHGSFNPRHGYLWITLAMNVSISVALYYLVIFYNLVHHTIKDHKPLSKLLCIKAVLFVIFWQSVLIAALSYIHWLPVLDIGGSDDASSIIINNLLISAEMVLLSLVNIYAFSNLEYRDLFNYTTLNPADEEDEDNRKKDYTSKRMNNLIHGVMNPRDLVSDGKHIFTGKETKIL